MKANRYILFPIFLVVVVDNFGYSLLFNLLSPLLLKPEYGMIAASTSIQAKNAMLALIFGVFPLAQFLAAPLIGEFADIHGRKKAFVLSLTGMILGFLLSALAVLVQGVWLLFLSRIVTGLFAGNICICLATIADVSLDEKKRGRNFALVAALYGVSWISAMVVGGYIASPAGAFLFAAFLALVSLGVLVKTYQNTAPPNYQEKFLFSKCFINIKDALKLKSSLLYFGVYFAWSLSWIMAIQWYPPYAIEIFSASIHEYSFWYIVLGATWLLGALTARFFLIKWFKCINLCLLGFTMMTICLLVVQLSPDFYFLSLVIAIASFFSVLAMGSSLNLVSTSAPPNTQGKIMGLTQSAQSLAFTTASLLAFLVSLYSIKQLYLVVSFISFIGVILLLIKKFRVPRPTAGL